MVHFVGAGPGAPDLITVRGKQYLEEADVVIYACLLYRSPSPRDMRRSRMPSSA